MLLGACVVIGTGVALLLSASLGSDGYSTLLSGLTIWSGWSFGLISALVGGTLVVTAWARGVRPGVGTIASTLLVGLVIAVGLAVVPEPDALLPRMLLVLLAFPVLAVGIAAYLGTHTGAGPVEAVALAFDPPVAFRWSYGVVQVGGALIGWSLGAAVGPVTVLVSLLLGPAVAWLSQRFVLFRLPPRQHV